MNKFTETEKKKLGEIIEQSFNMIFSECSSAVPTNPIAACKYVLWALVRKVGLDLPKKKPTNDHK